MFEIVSNSNIRIDPDWGDRVTDSESIYRVEVIPSSFESDGIWYFFILLPSIDEYYEINKDLTTDEKIVYSVCCAFLKNDDKVNIYRVQSEEDFGIYDKATPVLSYEQGNPMRFVWLKPPKFLSC